MESQLQRTIHIVSEFRQAGEKPRFIVKQQIRGGGAPLIMGNLVSSIKEKFAEIT